LISHGNLSRSFFFLVISIIMIFVDSDILSSPPSLTRRTTFPIFCNIPDASLYPLRERERERERERKATFLNGMQKRYLEKKSICLLWCTFFVRVKSLSYPLSQDAHAVKLMKVDSTVAIGVALSLSRKSVLSITVLQYGLLTNYIFLAPLDCVLPSDKDMLSITFLLPVNPAAVSD
jgi:hypothetical protein